MARLKSGSALYLVPTIRLVRVEQDEVELEQESRDRVDSDSGTSRIRIRKKTGERVFDVSSLNKIQFPLSAESDCSRRRLASRIPQIRRCSLGSEISRCVSGGTQYRTPNGARGEPETYPGRGHPFPEGLAPHVFHPLRSQKALAKRRKNKGQLEICDST